MLEAASKIHDMPPRHDALGLRYINTSLENQDVGIYRRGVRHCGHDQRHDRFGIARRVDGTFDFGHEPVTSRQFTDRSLNADQLLAVILPRVGFGPYYDAFGLWHSGSWLARSGVYFPPSIKLIFLLKPYSAAC